MAHGDHLKYNAKAKEGKKTFFRLVSYLSCDKRLLFVIGFLIIVSIVANLLGSYMLRPIINDYIIPGDFHGLIRILLILAGVYLTGLAAVYIQYILLNKIGQRPSPVCVPTFSGRWSTCRLNISIHTSTAT